MAKNILFVDTPTHSSNLTITIVIPAAASCIVLLLLVDIHYRRRVIDLRRYIATCLDFEKRLINGQIAKYINSKLPKNSNIKFAHGEKCNFIRLAL